MSKVCLVVMYNHQFLKNVDKLDKLYGDRFDKIYHIMPFYRGDKDRVISVYENSYQFSGYIAQAIDKIYDEEFSHYVFLADDVVLNPRFSKDTMHEFLKLDDNTGFTARNTFVYNERYLQTKVWMFPSIINYLYAENKPEIEKLLPTIDEMVEKYKQLNFKCKLVSENKIKYIQDFIPVSGRRANFFYKYDCQPDNLNSQKLMASYEDKQEESKKYMFPFAGGFSDFFVIPKKSVKQFAYYAGIFASLRIFAEVAIPTALCISLDKLNCPKDIGYEIINYASNDPGRKELPEQYERSLKRLYDDWDYKRLIVHPVKFSMWENDLG